MDTVLVKANQNRINAWAGLPVQRTTHPTPEVVADYSKTSEHSAAD
jgi:hypothetical protein